jgi:hypothetical protein
MVWKHSEEIALVQALTTGLIPRSNEYPSIGGKREDEEEENRVDNAELVM